MDTIVRISSVDGITSTTSLSSTIYVQKNSEGRVNKIPQKKILELPEKKDFRFNNTVIENSSKKTLTRQSVPKSKCLIKTSDSKTTHAIRDKVHNRNQQSSSRSRSSSHTTSSKKLKTCNLTPSKNQTSISSRSLSINDAGSRSSTSRHNKSFSPAGHSMSCNESSSKHFSPNSENKIDRNLDQVVCLSVNLDANEDQDMLPFISNMPPPMSSKVSNKNESNNLEKQKTTTNLAPNFTYSDKFINFSKPDECNSVKSSSLVREQPSNTSKAVDRPTSLPESNHKEYHKNKCHIDDISQRIRLTSPTVTTPKSTFSESHQRSHRNDNSNVGTTRKEMSSTNPSKSSRKDSISQNNHNQNVNDNLDNQKKSDSAKSKSTLKEYQSLERDCDHQASIKKQESGITDLDKASNINIREPKNIKAKQLSNEHVSSNNKIDCVKSSRNSLHINSNDNTRKANNNKHHRLSCPKSKKSSHFISDKNDKDYSKLDILTKDKNYEDSNHSNLTRKVINSAIKLNKNIIYGDKKNAEMLETNRKEVISNVAKNDSLYGLTESSITCKQIQNVLQSSKHFNRRVQDTNVAEGSRTSYKDPSAPKESKSIKKELNDCSYSVDRVIETSIKIKGSNSGDKNIITNQSDKKGYIPRNDFSTKSKCKQLLGSSYLSKLFKFKTENKLEQLTNFDIDVNNIMKDLRENDELMRIMSSFNSKTDLKTEESLEEALKEMDVSEDQISLLKDKVWRMFTLLSPELIIKKIDDIKGNSSNNISDDYQQRASSFLSESKNDTIRPLLFNREQSKEGLKKKSLNMLKSIVGKITSKRKDYRSEVYLNKKTKIEPPCIGTSQEFPVPFLRSTGTLFGFPGAQETTETGRFGDLDSSPDVSSKLISGIRKPFQHAKKNFPVVKFVDNTHFDDLERNSAASNSQSEPLDLSSKSDRISCPATDSNLDSEVQQYVNSSDCDVIEQNVPTTPKEKQYLLDKFLEAMDNDDPNLIMTSRKNNDYSCDSVLRDLSRSISEQPNVSVLSKSSVSFTHDNDQQNTLSSSVNVDPTILNAPSGLLSIENDNPFSLSKHQDPVDFPDVPKIKIPLLNEVKFVKLEDTQDEPNVPVFPTLGENESCPSPQLRDVNDPPDLDAILNFIDNMKRDLITEHLTRSRRRNPSEDSLNFLIDAMHNKEVKKENTSSKTAFIDLYLLRQLQRLHGVQDPISASTIFPLPQSALKHESGKYVKPPATDDPRGEDVAVSPSPSDIALRSSIPMLSQDLRHQSSPMCPLAIIPSSFQDRKAPLNFPHTSTNIYTANNLSRVPTTAYLQDQNLAVTLSPMSLPNTLYRSQLPADEINASLDSNATIYNPSASRTSNNTDSVLTISGISNTDTTANLTTTSTNLVSSVPVHHKPPVHPSSLPLQQEIASLVSMWQCRPLAALTNLMKGSEMPVTTAQLSVRKYASIYMPTAQERSHFKVFIIVYL